MPRPRRQPWEHEMDHILKATLSGDERTLMEALNAYTGWRRLTRRDRNLHWPRITAEGPVADLQRAIVRFFKDKEAREREERRRLKARTMRWRDQVLHHLGTRPDYSPTHSPLVHEHPLALARAANQIPPRRPEIARTAPRPPLLLSAIAVVHVDDRWRLRKLWELLHRTGTDQILDANPVPLPYPTARLTGGSWTQTLLNTLWHLTWWRYPLALTVAALQDAGAYLVHPDRPARASVHPDRQPTVHGLVRAFADRCEFHTRLPWYFYPWLELRDGHVVDRQEILRPTPHATRP